MSWRKISSQGIGTGDAIFAPSQTRIFIFQDGNTGSHEKASHCVGIENAVFTSSKHRIFIFFITGQNQKAAECRAARLAKRSVLGGLGGSPTSRKHGSRHRRLPCFRGFVLQRHCLQKTEKCIWSNLHFISQAVPTYICCLICLLGQRPKPFEQPLPGLAARSETERY